MMLLALLLAPASIPCATAPAQMACVPGGPFLRGSDTGAPDARPQGTVWVQTFYMDVYEVTVAQYEACVASGKCKKAQAKKACKEGGGSWTCA